MQVHHLLDEYRDASLERDQSCDYHSFTSLATLASCQYTLIPNSITLLHFTTTRQAVTLIVGYFVLGPSDLYKLVKEIGKFIQNFRTLGAEATKSFESTMENQLEMTELRKAQAELNEAFSFRRSINTDSDAEAFGGTSFTDNASSASEGSGAIAATAVVGPAAGATTVEGEDGAVVKKKRRLVRRKKKVVVEKPTEEEREIEKEYPDLDILESDFPESRTVISEEERLRTERLERLGGSTTTSEPDWFKASDEDVASKILDQPAPANPALERYETDRFKSQLSAEQWNAQIMANEDELAPLSMVMKRLAILEEEKQSADRLLEEEYQKRMDNEDKYYLEKRRVLEEAITDIQEGVYASKDAETASGPKFS
jgi:Sec-independent protein translocase protein TatA